MLSRLAYVLLTLTSIAPVALIYGAAEFSSRPWLAINLFVVASGLALACDALLRYARHHAEIEPLNMVSVRSANHEVLAFFLAYLLPLLVREDSSGAGQPLAIFLFIGLLTVVVFQSNLMHVNPLMAILGYAFYEVSAPSGYTYLLVTKNKTNQLSGRRAVQLSSTLLLEV